MKKKILYRSLPVILSLATLFTVCFTPAAAASNLGLYSVDLMETDSITWGNERDNYPNTYTGYDWYTGNNIYFHWTPPVQNIKLQYIYITIYSSVNPRSPVLYPYDGATSINGTLISTYNNYYQYKFNIGVAIGDLTFCSRYGGTERYFSIVSAQGYADIYEQISTFNVYGFSEEVLGTTGNVDRVNVINQTGVNIPYQFGAGQANSTNVNWYYFYIDIPRSSYNFNTYSQITFIYDYVGAAVMPTFSLYAAGSSEPAIIIDSPSIQTFTYSTHSFGTGGNEFTPISTQVTVDLSEYDLSLYTMDLCLCIQPEYIDSRTGQQVWVNMRGIYLDQLVHEPTWYETFFSWIQKTLGINTDKIVDKLDSLFADSSDGAISDQKDRIEDQASSANDAAEIIAGIEEPEVNLDDVFSYVPTPQPLSKTILTTLISIPEVEQIALISFVFMFAGLVVFGIKL